MQRASELGCATQANEATNLYFYLLNNYFSDSMRERIFFYENIYRVAQKTWLISVVFAGLTLLTAFVEFLCRHSLLYPCRKGGYFLLLVVISLLAHRSAASRYKEILYGQRKWLAMRRPLVDALLRDGYDAHPNP